MEIPLLSPLATRSTYNSSLPLVLLLVRLCFVSVFPAANPQVATKFVPAGGNTTFEGIPTNEGIQELLFSLPRCGGVYLCCWTMPDGALLVEKVASRMSLVPFVLLVLCQVLVRAAVVHLRQHKYRTLRYVRRGGGSVPLLEINLTSPRRSGRRANCSLSLFRPTQDYPPFT